MFLFAEPDLLHLVSENIDNHEFPQVIVLGRGDSELPFRALDYDELVNPEPAEISWAILDERTASSLCYTSGTTGDPKGILYSHRSSVLHAMAVCRTDTWAVSGNDVICLFAPMFHVNGWGIPHAAALCGADLVLPGPHLSPRNIYDILEGNHVTFAMAVPTLWHDLLNYLDESNLKLTKLRRVLVSGSPLPPDMLARFEDDHGVDVLQAWGMTESSPMGMVSRLTRRMAQGSKEDQRRLKLRQGRPVFGVEAKLNLIDDTDATKQSTGECMIRGHWVASSYFKSDAKAAGAFLDGGWFKTGDIAETDEDGFFRLLDRQKDAIKSGGEWISSIEIENAARHYNQVTDAAAVAIPSEKWGERPVLAISVRDQSLFDQARLRAIMSNYLQKWAMPDHIILLSTLPRSDAGKLLKTEIREKVQISLQSLAKIERDQHRSLDGI
jgi:fatty-acyl-CoA synthase